ncbi:MAG: transposase, partial [Myxococcus sp.]|nr:transposase [Myxococcus sp.]
RRLEDGRYEYTPKKGVTFAVTAQQLVRRLVSLVPPAKTHLTSFHGVYAPHAALRPLVTAPPPKPASSSAGRRGVGAGLRRVHRGRGEGARHAGGERGEGAQGGGG